MQATIDAIRCATAGRRGVACLIALGLALLLAGCGGSGSSGFDALAAENDAIDRAIEGQDCTVENGLTICASTGSEPAPSATPTPTATQFVDATVTGTPSAMVSRTATARTTGTPTPSAVPTATATTTAPGHPVVEVDLDSSDIANCEGLDLSQPCVVTVTFMTANTPASAVYRAASRARNPDSIWTLHPDTGYQAFIVVPAEVAQLQVAILVFNEEPGPLPDEVELLADSGADQAFVTAPVTVRTAP
jgi:hypothetical protein